MTEVRLLSAAATGSQYGLFATKDYQTGDVILPASACLIRLSPVNRQEEESIIDANFPDAKMPHRAEEHDASDNAGSPSLLDLIDITVPAADKSDKDEGLVGSSPLATSRNGGDDGRIRRTLQCMVQAALCFVHHASLDAADETKLLSLYHPPLSTAAASAEEEVIVTLSIHALEYMKTIAQSQDVPSSKLKDMLASESGCTKLQKIMLIWACNSFAGGRVYDVFSRINHLCNPNSVVVVADDNNNECVVVVADDNVNTPNNNESDEAGQLLKAACTIRTGEEITISYLGPWLYADTPTRQAALRRDKFFTCLCNRCGDTADEAGASPSDANTSVQQQPDTSAASDMVTARQTLCPDTAQSIPCPVCHPRTARQLPEDVQYDDELEVHYVCPHNPCPNCGFVIEQGSTAGNGRATAKASYTKLFQTNQSVVSKVVTFLRHHVEETGVKEGTSSNRFVLNGGSAAADENDESADQLEIFNEQLEQHLTMASSVLGARHWTTNLIMLHMLDQTLSGLHAKILTDIVDNGDDDGDDKEATMETIASAIDMLERILRYVNGLQLHLHMGHLLSHVIVGTARALVSLGDVKSQKYAADWIAKLSTGDGGESDFVHHFESTGLQKVVETVRSAWQRHPDSERPEKRAKR